MDLRKQARSHHSGMAVAPEAAAVAADLAPTDSEPVILISLIRLSKHYAKRFKEKEETSSIVAACVHVTVSICLVFLGLINLATFGYKLA